MKGEANSRRLQPGILLIAYHFPPSAAVGGTRMASFARCLVPLGWNPHVLTIRDEDVELLDPQRLQVLEGVTIHNARVLPSIERMYAAVKTRLTGRAKDAPTAGESVDTAAGSHARETVTRRIKRYILSFLALPDWERGWMIPATLAAIRRVRRDGIPWIMTSCPPYSVHLIGLAVRRLTGARWVADFRDPWMTAERKQLYPTSAWSLRLDEWMERQVVDRADIIVFNVRRLRDAYAERYSHQPRDKFVFLPNGISAFGPLDATPVAKYDTFTIAYTGSL